MHKNEVLSISNLVYFVMLQVEWKVCTDCNIAALYQYIKLTEY